MEREGFDLMNLVWVFFKCRGRGGLKGFEGYLTPNSLFEWRARGEQREWEWFVDEPCLDFFKSGEGGVRSGILPLLTPLFQFPKLEEFRGEEGFKLSILLLWCQFICISLKLANNDHNCQFIWPLPPCPPFLPLISKHPNKEVDISVPLTLPNVFKTSKQRDGVTIPLPFPFTLLSTNFQTHYKRKRWQAINLTHYLLYLCPTRLQVIS